MSITPLGYLFLASVLFGIVLNMGVSRRQAIKGKANTFFTKLYIGLILVTISTLFFMFSVLGANEVYKMVTLPKYEAVIIGVDSHWDKVSRTDSNGDSFSEDVLMYTPTLRFTDDRGETITKRGNISSGKAPVIGDAVRVAYGGDSVRVISAASIGLLIALSVMLLILGYILAEVTAFALGRKPKWIDRLGTVTFIIIIYGGMLFMLGAMIYGVFKYFQPGSNMPLWAMLLCAFFSLTLALALMGMIVGRARRKSH